LAMVKKNFNLSASVIGLDALQTDPAPEIRVTVAGEDILPEGAVPFGDVAADGAGGVVG
ncbi:MAG: hypothetical protein IIB31_10530, partial [Chloroflexi bacterium]|nr:hypothetical protein [Chloroflexota bacterium]